ncbi:hypothetical protein [Streptomyces albogriseolus]
MWFAVGLVVYFGHSYRRSALARSAGDGGGKRD